jgi:hypothetical protein
MSQREMEEEHVRMGRAFIRDVVAGNGFGHLGRYETALVRNLQRLVAELRAQQELRQGK